MIKEFIDIWDKRKGEVEAAFRQKFPASYEEIVCEVTKILMNANEYGCPDYERIHAIDDGDYQGTLLFVIAEKTYQPDKYWYVRANYGSCSGCDTLQAIETDGTWDIEGNKQAINDEQIKDLMTLALHIIQGLKEME